MMFTTPCFVRVKDAEERDKLLAWCENLGYTTSGFRFSMPQPVCYLFTSSDFVGRCGELAIGSLPAGAIDCGTDIELFKALAAMNDENDYMQYFVFAAQDQQPDEFFLCANQKWPKWVLPTCLSLGLSPRKATAEEIIEHFKNRTK